MRSLTSVQNCSLCCLTVFTHYFGTFPLSHRDIKFPKQKMMNGTEDGWFREVSAEMWPGQAMSLQVEELLYDDKSKYQDIKVFKTKTYGNVLVLDGVIQCTPRDEFAYQEMMSNFPVNCHPNPEKVLVIGGGDGGVVRELDKIPDVKQITMCEIDEKVVEVSKKYLDYMSTGFSSPKLTLHIGDGFDFMGKHKGQFDVIITDSSDPVGPAASLFQKEYYALMKSALRPGGIICAQGECLWLHLELIRSMQEFCRQLYPVVDYSYCTIPTYPSGQIGSILCSLNPDTNFREPLRKLSQPQVKELGLKYYNTDIHRASFVLPEFARKVLEEDK